MARLRYGSATSTRADKTIDAVLDAAEALVHEGALHGATIEELAARAGVSRATVFARFGSRLGILEALNVRCSGSAEITAIREAATIEEPAARIAALVEASCRFWESWGEVQRHLRAVVTLEPEVRPLIEAQREHQAGTLRDTMELADEAGLLRRDLDVPTAARIMHMLTGLEAFTELRREGGLDVDDTIEAIHALVRSLLRSD